jgi:hypothetical protein
MFERGIAKNDVLAVLAAGEVIVEYPDDKPYPSSLVLGWMSGRALHVVVAEDQPNRACYVITVYVPDPAVWSADFKRRRRQ